MGMLDGITSRIGSGGGGTGGDAPSGADAGGGGGGGAGGGIMSVANKSLDSASADLAGTNQGIKDQANAGVDQSREMQSLALGGSTSKESPAAEEDPSTTGAARSTVGADAGNRLA